jgi:hypothetical protein
MVGLMTKKGAQHAKAYAKGGKAHMFGKQAARPATLARTGKVQTPAPGAKIWTSPSSFNCNLCLVYFVPDVIFFLRTENLNFPF